MAILYIAESTGPLVVNGGVVPVPMTPFLAEQVVIFTTATASAAFNANTRLIAVRSDGDCHIAIGKAPTAKATDNSLYKAGETYLFGVQPGGGMKLSVVAASGS